MSDPVGNITTKTCKGPENRQVCQTVTKNKDGKIVSTGREIKRDGTESKEVCKPRKGDNFPTCDVTEKKNGKVVDVYSYSMPPEAWEDPKPVK